MLYIYIIKLYRSLSLCVQMHAGRTFGPLLRYHGARKGTRDRHLGAVVGCKHLQSGLWQQSCAELFRLVSECFRIAMATMNSARALVRPSSAKLLHSMPWAWHIWTTGDGRHKHTTIFLLRSRWSGQVGTEELSQEPHSTWVVDAR